MRAALLLSLALAACSSELTSDTDATQPPQPARGPGGRDYRHADWRVTTGGEGAFAWTAFEPIDPAPATAPIAIVMHGYYEYDGYAQMEELIRHTVRKGTIVVYPRWQTGTLGPCLGALDVEPCLTSARIAILDALDALDAPGHVHPDRERASYLGFSFGGLITANLANRHAAWGLPVPRAIFLDDPHDGGNAGPGEPALDDSLAGIPADVRIECHDGADGTIAGDDRASCNALFPRLGHIPADHKSLVLTRTDPHGVPVLSSAHGVSTAEPGEANAYDWNFVWRDWDALRRCALDDVDCALVEGDTPARRDLGTWSDGVPVEPLVIQAAAPLTP